VDSLAATEDDEIGSRDGGEVSFRWGFLVGSVGGDYSGGRDKGFVAVTASARGNYPLAGGGGAPPGSAQLFSCRGCSRLRTRQVQVRPFFQ